MKKYIFIISSFIFAVFIFGFVNEPYAQDKQSTILDKTKVDIPKLYPIPISAKVNTSVISLNGQWEVSIDEGKVEEVTVPGELVMQGVDFNVGETAHYQKTLEIPKDWKNKRAFIRFDAVSSYALVKLNGVTVGEHEGSFVPFQVEITDYIKKQNNVLQVDIKANTVSDKLNCTSQYAAHTVAGIIRKVTLFVLPEINMSDITIKTLFDKAFKNAKLEIETEIETVNNNFQELQLRYVLYSGKRQVFQKLIPVVSTGFSKTSVTVRRPHHWNPETPYLYDLIIELVQDGKVIQVNKQKVGFRQVEVKGGKVYVNGQSIKLRGVNRHSIHPLTGRSLSLELEWLDAKLFKNANCNFIRTSHYPPSEEFLNAADSIGLFVECEAALAWIGHPASPSWGKWDYKNEKFLLHMLKANIENIKANKNHPSVIIWSLGNESLWSPLWHKVNQVVKKMDAFRPTAFHDQTWGTFNNQGSKADIANYHYPGINDPKRTDTIARPTLFGEFAHVPTYNRRELMTDPGVREAYNAPLVQFYDSIYKHPNNIGGAIWSGIDDTFHLPDGRIVGCGPWGLLDGWRRKKPEYYGMKKAFSPIRVKGIKKLKGGVRVEVENRYDFTPLSKIKIKTKINGEIQNTKSKIPPRQTGFIWIPYKKDIEELVLMFYDINNLLVEEEQFNIGKIKVPKLENEKQLVYSENKTSYLVKQGNITYRISKMNGTVVSVKKGNELVLSQGPKFMIVPRNSEYGGKPNSAGESYQRNIQPIQRFPWYVKYASNITLKEKQDAIQMTMEVTFKKGRGTLWYTFKSNGQFITKYEIEQTIGEDSPYQYGLVLQLPKKFDQLSWHRKGDFSTYPKDHIGRNIGTVKLNTKVTTGVEPWREKPNHAWKDDANELGNNDFISTKRNIFQASLTENKGTKVTVISNAKQGSRTWLQEEHIYWLVADYSNNGSEPFYGSPHSTGRITTKDNVLKGTLKLTIE